MQRDLTQLSERPFDILIIGGGIHGVASAWHAARIGLRVGLVERADFGSGATSNSRPALHGGLRYMAAGDPARMAECAANIVLLRRLAPALVGEQRWMAPGGLAGLPRAAAGLVLAQVVARTTAAMAADAGLSGWQPTAPCFLRGAELRAGAPVLPPGASTVALAWSESCLHDSERLLLALVRDAAARGATMANYVEAGEVLSDASGQVTGLRVRDLVGDRELELRARVVVDTASWTAPDVVGLCAVNLVLDRGVGDYGLVLTPRRPVSAGRGPLLVEPCGGATVVGTFYVPWRYGRPLEQGQDDEVDLLLDTLRRELPALNSERTGLRMLQRGIVPADAAAELETRPRLEDVGAMGGPRGLLRFYGVDWTTALGAAREVLAAVCERVGRGRPRLGTRALVELASVCDELPGATPVDPQVARAEPAAVARAMDEAVDHGGAVHLEDFVVRRSGVGMLGWPGRRLVDAAAVAMADKLGWGAEQCRQEVERVERFYRDRLGRVAAPPRD
jgi:glycerol-3-phosphate dehydrogenase